jgi:hypothetical protein
MVGGLRAATEESVVGLLGLSIGSLVHTWRTRLCKWGDERTLSHSKQMKRGVYEQGKKN